MIADDQAEEPLLPLCAKGTFFFHEQLEVGPRSDPSFDEITDTLLERRFGRRHHAKAAGTVIQGGVRRQVVWGWRAHSLLDKTGSPLDVNGHIRESLQVEVTDPLGR